jgi:hypothetical protein
VAKKKRTRAERDARSALADKQQTPRITVEIVPPSGPLSKARQRAREEAMTDLVTRLLGQAAESDGSADLDAESRSK